MRLTDEEHAQLIAAAKAAGFPTTAAYVRHMTIGDGKGIQVEIKEDIKRILELLQNKK